MEKPAQASNKDGMSKLNSVLLAIVIALLTWTVRGVQELKEQNAGSLVTIDNVKESVSHQRLDINDLTKRAGALETDVAKLKLKEGIN